MSAQISPFLRPSSKELAPAAIESGAATLQGLVSQAGPVWQQLTDPIVGVPSGGVADAFAERVNQLSGELPGELNGLSIDIGTEIIDYEPNPSPPPLIRCVHRLLSSVSFQVDGGSLRLGFTIPCDCTA